MRNYLLFICHHPGHQVMFLSQRNTAKVEEEVEDLIFDNEVCEANIGVPVQRGLEGMEVIRLLPARIHHGDTLSTLNMVRNAQTSLAIQ